MQFSFLYHTSIQEDDGDEALTNIWLSFYI